MRLDTSTVADLDAWLGAGLLEEVGNPFGQGVEFGV